MIDKSEMKVFEAIGISEDRHNEIEYKWESRLKTSRLVNTILEEIHSDETLTLMEKIYIAYVFGTATG